MNQQLTLEISDEVYADLQRKADARGISVTEWIVTVLSQQGLGVSSTVLDAERREQARGNFRRYAGSISLKHEA